MYMSIPKALRMPITHEMVRALDIGGLIFIRSDRGGDLRGGLQDLGVRFTLLRRVKAGILRKNEPGDPVPNVTPDVRAVRPKFFESTIFSAKTNVYIVAFHRRSAESCPTSASSWSSRFASTVSFQGVPPGNWISDKWEGVANLAECARGECR